MGWHVWNKMVAASLSLAAAGVLACVAAVFDCFVPKASVGAFVAAMVPLGMAIAAVVVGFVWLCEKCEGYFKEYTDRLFRTRLPGPRVESKKDGCDEATGSPARPKKSSSRTISITTQWHGQ